MKIYLESAHAADVQWGVDIGLIDGVTTNPMLIADEHGELDARDQLAQICRLVDGPVTAEVVGVDAEGMYREGRDLARVADNVVVKIPMIEEGIVATRRLARDGVRINTTLVFTAAQALLAAKAGASFVSPFVGHLDDVGHDGVGVVDDIRRVFDNYALECEILAASVRSPAHFLDCAKAGADIVSVPTDVLKAVLLHPLTDRGLDQLLNDWSRCLAKSRAGG